MYVHAGGTGWGEAGYIKVRMTGYGAGLCGMYQVGTFPNWDVWGEWNGKFRDDFRY